MVPSAPPPAPGTLPTALPGGISRYQETMLKCDSCLRGRRVVRMELAGARLCVPNPWGRQRGLEVEDSPPTGGEGVTQIHKDVVPCAGTRHPSSKIRNLIFAGIPHRLSSPNAPVPISSSPGSAFPAAAPAARPRRCAPAGLPASQRSPFPGHAQRLPAQRGLSRHFPAFHQCWNSADGRSPSRLGRHNPAPLQQPH